MLKMAKYTHENWIHRVLELIPGFRSAWEAHLEYWGDDPVGLTMDLTEFAEYTNARFEADEDSEIEAIFSVVEELLESGSENLVNAVTTGFLESVINPMTAESPHLPRLANVLGSQARAYCREWLAFSGGNLPGI
jgi:hypothetical protein